MLRGLLNSLPIRVKLNNVTIIVSKQCFQFLLLENTIILYPFHLSYYGQHWGSSCSWPSNWTSIKNPVGLASVPFRPYGTVRYRSLSEVLVLPSTECPVRVEHSVHFISMLICVLLIPFQRLGKMAWTPASPEWSLKPKSSRSSHRCSDDSP